MVKCSNGKTSIAALFFDKVLDSLTVCKNDA